MRRIFITVFGVVCILASMPAAMADTASVEALATKKKAVLELLHGKARKALVTAAQDSRYRTYFSADSAEERSRLKSDIDRISLEVQSHFHVEEMCLIDPNGAEISRIVGNAIAYDLATNETENVFFAPSFALKQRTVYTSPTYMSPDANRWVVAYVTPIVLDNETKAILHYEHGLDVYQHVLNKDAGGDDRFILAVSSEGWVLSDSRAAIAVDMKQESESPETYFPRFRLGGLNLGQLRAQLGGGERGSGTLSDSGKLFDVAYETVGDWTLIVADRHS
jgi:hypothetical protein